MRETYPDLGSPEAVAEGCTCEANQTNPNWRVVDGKCPVHANVDYYMWQAEQQRRKPKSKKGA